MKKLLSVFLVFSILLSLFGCEKETEPETKKFKVGMVCIGNPNEAYTAAHVNGLNAVASELGIDVVYKYDCGEGGEKVQTALEDLVEEGCNLIISNSYGHQSYTQQVASDNPNLFFVASTGDNMAASGLKNISNAFPYAFEGRYLAGIVAGLKLKELVEDNKLTAQNYDDNGNIKIGYVSAYSYAECVSGYSAFYLGVKSIVDNVTMLVTFTSDWSSAPLEKTGAEKLVAEGCVIISQHADTTGAPSAVEAAHNAGKVVYCVGYNASFLEVAPESCLTSAINNWNVAYKYIVQSAMNGKQPSDWAQGLNDNAVGISDLGKNCAKGTKEYIDNIIKQLKSGELQVFDTSKFTVAGAQIVENADCVDGWFLDAIGGNAVKDGYFHESEYRSAPYFCCTIDGIVTID